MLLLECFTISLIVLNLLKHLGTNQGYNTLLLLVSLLLPLPVPLDVEIELQHFLSCTENRNLTLTAAGHARTRNSN